LYIGLPNTIANRKAAEIKAQPIELDMTSGNFDRSLAKYKPQAQSEAISVVEMFDRFTQQKQRTISIGGLAKYLSLQQHILVFFKGKTSVSVSESMAEKFRAYLAQKLEPVTLRQRIVMMNACWESARKKKLVVENPWAQIKVSVVPKQRPQPFTLAEISSMVRKFRSDSNLIHYAD
jgi:integrase